MRPKIVKPNENNVLLKLVPEDHAQFFCTTCASPYHVDAVKTRDKVTSFILSCPLCNKGPHMFTTAVLIKMYHTLPQTLVEAAACLKVTTEEIEAPL